MFFIFGNLNKSPRGTCSEDIAPSYKNGDEKLCILSIFFWQKMWYAYDESILGRAGQTVPQQPKVFRMRGEKTCLALF